MNKIKSEGDHLQWIGTKGGMGRWRIQYIIPKPLRHLFGNKTAFTPTIAKPRDMEGPRLPRCTRHDKTGFCLAKKYSRHIIVEIEARIAAAWAELENRKVSWVFWPQPVPVEAERDPITGKRDRSLFTVRYGQPPADYLHVNLLVGDNGNLKAAGSEAARMAIEAMNREQRVALAER